MSLLWVNSGIKSLLDSEVFIDNWGIPIPTNLPKIVDNIYYPSTSGILNPLTNVTVERDGHANVSTEATFDANVVWRFNGNCGYEDLKIKEVENLVEWVNTRAVMNPADIHESVKALTVSDQDNPVLVTRTQDDSDWLIYATFQWDIIYNTNPVDPNDLGEIQPPILRPSAKTLSTLRLRTHKALELPSLDNSELDKEIELE